MNIYHSVRDFTMTSEARVNVLCDEVRRVCAEGVPGAIVECGVWKGGSMMAAAFALSGDREIVMFDTFLGMPEPGPEDADYAGASAAKLMADDAKVRAECGLDEVRRNMGSTGYANVRYVQGLVEDTVPAAAPDTIAVLRLDTDWYTSTRHCLEHLWSRVSPGGVLIVDDYGHWAGAKKAVDEFFGGKPAMSQIDYTGVLIRKP